MKQLHAPNILTAGTFVLSMIEEAIIRRQDGNLYKLDQQNQFGYRYMRPILADGSVSASSIPVEDEHKREVVHIIERHHLFPLGIRRLVEH